MKKDKIKKDGISFEYEDGQEDRKYIGWSLKIKPGFLSKIKSEDESLFKKFANILILRLQEFGKGENIAKFKNITVDELEKENERNEYKVGIVNSLVDDDPKVKKGMTAYCLGQEVKHYPYDSIVVFNDMYRSQKEWISDIYNTISKF